jgi:hypothetical protein
MSAAPKTANALRIRCATRYTQLSAAPFKDFWS